MFILRSFVSACLIAATLSAARAEQAEPIAPLVAVGNDTLEVLSNEATEEKETIDNLPMYAANVVSNSSDESHCLTIALLMPPDGSPFTSASKIIGNGLLAASKTSATPAEILLIEAPESTSLQDVVETAVVSGADVVVGPLQRERVGELVRMSSLPLPIVALNMPATEINLATVSSNLLLFTLSTDIEADYIAQLAVNTLHRPEATKPVSVTKNDVTSPMSVMDTTETDTEKLLILTQSDSWETRIAERYEAVLRREGIPYEIYRIDDMDLRRLREKVSPRLSEEDERRFAQRRQELLRLPSSTESERRIRTQALKRLDSDRSVRRAESTPPYAGILLALDAQSASVIRSSLPRKSRIWGTSTSNPGDPTTSSTATALAFDLEGLIFAESPLLLRYDAQSFEARFATAMPYSLAAKRLFAFGVDAYGIARQWAQSQSTIELEGETGRLVVQRAESPVVRRTPQTVIVHQGHLIEIAPQRVARPGPLPKIEVPLRQTLSVKEVISSAGSITVKPILIEDDGSLPPVPSKMLPIQPTTSTQSVPVFTPLESESNSEPTARPFEQPFDTQSVGETRTEEVPAHSDSFDGTSQYMPRENPEAISSEVFTSLP